MHTISDKNPYINTIKELEPYIDTFIVLFNGGCQILETDYQIRKSKCTVLRHGGPGY